MLYCMLVSLRIRCSSARQSWGAGCLTRRLRCLAGPVVQNNQQAFLFPCQADVGDLYQLQLEGRILGSSKLAPARFSTKTPEDPQALVTGLNFPNFAKGGGRASMSYILCASARLCLTAGALQFNGGTLPSQDGLLAKHPFYNEGELCQVLAF